MSAVDLAAAPSREALDAAIGRLDAARVAVDDARRSVRAQRPLELPEFAFKFAGPRSGPEFEQAERAALSAYRADRRDREASHGSNVRATEHRLTAAIDEVPRAAKVAQEVAYRHRLAVAAHWMARVEVVDAHVAEAIARFADDIEDVIGAAFDERDLARVALADLSLIVHTPEAVTRLRDRQSPTLPSASHLIELRKTVRRWAGRA